MKILLLDILRTSLEEVWPSVEHSLGLMYLASAVKRRFGYLVQVEIWTLISKPGKMEEDIVNIRQRLDEYEPEFVLDEEFSAFSVKLELRSNLNLSFLDLL